MKYNKKQMIKRGLFTALFTVFVAGGLFAGPVADLSISSAIAQERGQIKIIDLSKSGATMATKANNSSNSVNVRTAHHPTYDRLVFDWGKRVSVTRKDDKVGNNNRVRMTFDSAGTLPQAVSNNKSLPRVKTLKVLGTNPLDIELVLNGAYMKRSELGSRIVFDFYDIEQPAPNAGQRISSETPAVVETQSQKAPAVAASSKKGAQILIVRGNKTPPKQDVTKKIADAEDIQENKDDSAKDAIPSVAGEITVSQALSSPSLSNVAEKKNTSFERVEPLVQTVDAEDFSPNDDGLTSRERAVNDAIRMAKKTTLDTVDSVSSHLVVGDNISISSLRPLKLAVFRRADTLWIVQSDKRKSVPPVINSRQNVSLDAIEDSQGTAQAWRIAIDKNAFFNVVNNEFSWDVQITDSYAPDPSLDLRSEKIDYRGQQTYALIMNVERPSAVLSFNDPELGDRFFAVPLHQDRLKVNIAQTLPEFSFIPADVGVVVKPQTETLELFFENTELFITSREGLMVSEALSSASMRFSQKSKDNESSQARLFDLDNWFVTIPQEYQENRRVFEMQAAATTDQNERIRNIIDLAKLYFVNGFGSEAAGLMRMAKQGDKRLVDNITFLALEGAALALADQHDKAKILLEDGRIFDQPEIALWRGYSNARQGNWKKAYDDFAATGNLVMQYPDTLKPRLLKMMAEAALNVQDVINAENLITVFDGLDNATRKDDSATQFFKGKLAFLNKDYDKAKPYLQAASNGSDRYYRAKAAFEFLKLQEKTDSMTTEEVSEILERLRYIWRGDDFEIDVTEHLGDFYIKKGQYREGLNTLRSIIPLLENDQDKTEEITQKLTQTFGALFIEDRADKKLPPLTALALYNEFSELTPSGADGDRAIQNLAERMVDVDLLDRAASLLEHQIKFRLQGDEKHRVATRLAAIRLIDSSPTAAIEALDRLKDEILSDDLKEQGLLLRARALSQLGRPDDAIKILSGLNSEDAHRLNIDTNWRAGRWMDAARAIDPLLNYALEKEDLVSDGGQVMRLTPEASDLVLNKAVAFVLAGEQGEVRELFRTYGLAMQGTRNADLFTLITRAPKPGELADLSTLQSHVSEVDMFNSFLEAYRRPQEVVPTLEETDTPSNDVQGG